MRDESSDKIWKHRVTIPCKWSFVVLFMKSTWKPTKTTDSTQISHLDLAFHRVQREGQLGISYMYAHICFVFCIIWFHYGFHKIQHNFTKTKMISWDVKWFHEIQLDFTKSNKISLNPQEFTGLHKIQMDLMKVIRISLKSTEFHRISLNPTGFHKFSLNQTQVHVKSTRFHYGFHEHFIKSNRISHNIVKSNTILLKAIGFHETQRIQSISWNPTRFTKSNRISQDFLKSTEFNTIS